MVNSSKAAYQGVGGAALKGSCIHVRLHVVGKLRVACFARADIVLALSGVAWLFDGMVPCAMPAALATLPSGAGGICSPLGLTLKGLRQIAVHAAHMMPA